MTAQSTGYRAQAENVVESAVNGEACCNSCKAAPGARWGRCMSSYTSPVTLNWAGHSNWQLGGPPECNVTGTCMMFCETASRQADHTLAVGL